MRSTNTASVLVACLVLAVSSARAQSTPVVDGASEKPIRILGAENPVRRSLGLRLPPAEILADNVFAGVTRFSNSAGSFFEINPLNLTNSVVARIGGSKNTTFQFYDGSYTYDLALYSAGTQTVEINASTTGLSYFTGGNLGVGTPSPNQKLEVQGITRFSNSSGSYLDINPIHSTNLVPRISGSKNTTFQYYDGTYSYDLAMYSGNNQNVEISSSGNSYFNGGSVGIGTAAPTAILQVGSNYPAQFIDQTTNGIPNGYLLKLPGNGSIEVGGIQIGKTALPYIQTTAGSGLGTLYLNRESDNDVVIGSSTSTHALKVEGTGTSHFYGSVIVDGDISAKYQDVAEWVPASEELLPGTLVAIDPTKSNHVTATTRAYESTVAGVVSPRPGIILGEASADKALVATTGRVRVRVTAEARAIHAGDLLVASEERGIAMTSVPINVNGVDFHRPGTVIGKALESLPSGRGEILVLLTLQ